MKFHIEKIILWLENSHVRELTFVPNKVNVVTGDSNTGKTAILDIIDYCFFASKHKISESVINENVNWYGLIFCINEKKYTLARKSPKNNKVSDEYYFSSIAGVPKKPTDNNSAKSIKDTLEVEFGIDRNTKIPFGGRKLKANSKISLRYFLLFNTISQDIITNSEVFFDKQSEDRYREALPRIFDIAVGIDTIENTLKTEKRAELEANLKRLKRKSEVFDSKQSEFYSEMNTIIKKAKEYSLIKEDETDTDSIDKLKQIVSQATATEIEESQDAAEGIKKEIYLLKRKIRNLNKFSREYTNYKSGLKEIQDSLKPIEFIKENSNDLIKTSIYKELVEGIEKDLENIKQSVRTNSPIDSKTSDIIYEYQSKINELEKNLSLLPEAARTFTDEKHKYIFIGEIGTKLDLYQKKPKKKDTDITVQIEQVENELNELVVEDTKENRELFIKLLEEVILGYIEHTQNALENYGQYHPVFNYKDKKLQIRKPKTDFIENVGSSSNHMFLHLFLFLGLHEAIMRKNAVFTPSFLIIDQPSRPYWGDEDRKKEKLDSSDEYKIKMAFSLLDKFMETSREEIEKEFQMIVFEHIPSKIWHGMENIHLVEEFKNGNALIPDSMKK
ncbi:MAG: DUF3732 domain-containing protein [Myxococcota bacterium]|nr:DUF3732 domain-containing protein [Myxococcota bacterium]